MTDEPKVSHAAGLPGTGPEPFVMPALPGETPVAATTPPSAIFDEVVAELRRFIWGVVRDSNQVDDVIQATYIKAMERGAAAHPDTAKGWLFRVAYNEALVVKRREAARDRTTRRLANQPIAEPSRPDEGLLRAETVQAVRQAMLTLSEAQRRVVLARMHGDQTFAEIARDCEMPLGTVLTHMRRALEKMRRALDLGD